MSVEEVIVVDARQSSIAIEQNDRLVGLSVLHATIDGRATRTAGSGSKIIVSIPRLRDGTHDLVVTSKSRLPWASERTAQSKLIVDTRPPRAKVSIRQRRLDASQAAVTISITTEPEADVELNVGTDRIELRADNGRTTHQTRLGVGDHRVWIKTTDRAGNRSESSQRLVVDVSAPTAGWVSSPEVVASNEPTLRASLTDDRWDLGVVVSATIDGSPARVERANRSASVQADGALSEGRHEAAITVADAAGNTATARHDFVVDSSDVLGLETLRNGARGLDVKLLQQELVRSGTLDKSAVSGSYDSSTVEAVRQFQSAEGLDVDGVAGPFTIAALTLRVEIDQSDHELVLHRYGRPWRRYSIAVGQPKYPTPNGDFRIVDKQKDPTWTPPNSEWAKDAKVTPPGPDNPLGTRWMGLDTPTIGIHGTNSPESLGYSVSHGCIRMSIEDVEQLFDLVEEGTRVRIKP